ncbi:MAG: hypothetical protein MZU91_06350 [Desulfosudis oleivorans]|nr:hypothetical protein [Desulfosudis oleivorans]
MNIREIQDLLGHKNVETAMIYTCMMGIVSPTHQKALSIF